MVSRLYLRDRDGVITAHAYVDTEDWFDCVSQGSWYYNAEKGCVQCATPRPVGGRRRVLKLHRFILGLEPGDPEVDHADGDPLNNRKSNLRVCTPALNAQNKNQRSDNTSGFRGVTWNKRLGKWQAQAMLDGKMNYLGVFVERGDAVAVVKQWRAEHMPFSAEAQGL